MAHENRTQAEVVAPLAGALAAMAAGQASKAADELRSLDGQIWRLGGSNAQREMVEETRIHTLLQASRHDEARELLDTRLDRRHCRRDQLWRGRCDDSPARTRAESS